MIPGDAVLDAFINANILFLVAYFLWMLSRGLLSTAGLKHAYGTQLKLLNSVFLAIICAPVVAVCFQSLQSTGIASTLNLNLSDIVVSYYLNGGIDMNATKFEGLLSLRETFILNVMNGAGWIAWFAITIFAIGFTIGLGRLIYSFYCLRSIVADSYAWRTFGPIQIRLSDRTLVPFSTRGLRNYYVVLPSQMLAQTEELKVSLAHEFQHIRQGDLEWEILLEVLKPLFFLNPAYHAWKRQVEDLRELNCDCEVLSRGRINLTSYCNTLLSVCQKALRRDRAFVIAVPKVTLVTADRTSFGRSKPSFLENRILSLLHARKFAHQKLLYAAIVLPLVASIALATVAIQRPGDWSHDRLMLSTVVNLERLEKINKMSTFGRIRN